MITYEYKCSVCGHHLETRQSIKDKPLIICPACSQRSLERIMFGGIHGAVRQDAKTIGQQMERNSKKFGKNKVQELDAQNKHWQRNQHQEHIEKIISGGKERVERYIRDGK